jgi:acetyl esterase
VPMSRITDRARGAALRGVFELPAPLRRLAAGAPVRVDGQTLDPDLALLLRLMRLEGSELASAGASVAKQRRAIDGSADLTADRRVGAVTTRTVAVPVDGDTVPARLYTPAGLAAGSPLLVFYHGGGWVIGSLDSHDNTCRFLAERAGTRVLSVGYRLAPEHPFPAATADALAGFRYAVDHAEELGADPAAVAVGGDSAGGNLAAVTCHLAAASGGPRPVFALLFYPGTDAVVRRPSRDRFGAGYFLTDQGVDWFLGHYIPDVEQRADPRFSVLRAPNLAAFPPTYLTVGGFDPLRDEVVAFAERLAEAGVPVALRVHPDLIHGFVNFLGISHRSREAAAEAAGALRTGFAQATARVPSAHSPKV